jgi:dTMP kinase
MKFIVIEGLDGSGKSTQINLVKKYFDEKGIRSKFIHFPRMDSFIYGDLIARFLRGELGDINSVNPYLVALIYAGDRSDASATLLRWMQEGYVVIADRYLYSNIAFQCAKLSEFEQKSKLAKWIKTLEYEYNKIPIPDLNLFLNVPFDFTKNSLRKGRKGSDRDYLKGEVDIHEADLSFQEKVREVYLWQVKENTDFEMIDCSNDQGKMVAAESIAKNIILRIESKLFTK